MPESLVLTSVQLRVSNLHRSLPFYLDQLGFVLASQSEGRADLAIAPQAPPILTLSEHPEATRPARATAGLFHAALLLPSRAALGAWLARAAERGVSFDGFADHGVSEAIYLSDPDGIGFEFYLDRPRPAWPFVGGELAMTTDPLDVQGLLGAGAPAAGLPPLAGARWGHLHLRVTDLERSEAFYRSVLGLDVMQRSYPGARFLAADGYHHHLGLNTWGRPQTPAAPKQAGLIEAVWARRAAPAETTLADPDGISLRIRPLAAAAS
jgi:catechol 2,3-dioxygenase